MRLAFAMSLVFAFAGCEPDLPASFACTVSSQCVSHGMAGVCEPTGACSFPDVTCASGRRYGALGPAPLAGACTESIADGGTDGSVSDGVPPGPITRMGTSTRPAGPPGAGVVLDAPAGLQGGDFLLASIFADANTGTVTPPTGWMQHAFLDGSASGNYAATWLFHVAGPNEPASWTFVVAAGPTSVAGALVVYRNVATSAPFDTQTSASFVASGFTAPSITTTVANDMLVAMFVDGTMSGLSIGAPSGMSSAISSDPIGIFDALQPTTGPTGSKTAPLSPSPLGIGAVDYVALAPR
jgi:hypothetical protein